MLVPVAIPKVQTRNRGTGYKACNYRMLLGWWTGGGVVIASSMRITSSLVGSEVSLDSSVSSRKGCRMVCRDLGLV